MICDRKKTTALGRDSARNSLPGMVFKFACVIAAMPTTPCYAREQYIGLIQNGDAIGRAEAVTTSAPPSSMAMYNPALLRRNDAIQLRLLGVEASADSRSLKDSLNSNSSAKQSSAQSIEGLYSRINNRDEPVSAAVNISALDFAVPWFSAQTFGASSLSSVRVSDPTEDYYDLNARLRVGGILGVGVGFNRLSIGLSQYYFSESGIRTTPRVSVSEAINHDIDAGTYSNTSAAFSDFTSIRYGNATGRNVGALVHWRDDNPSAIGYSILNLGGTKMQTNAPSIASGARSQEDKMQNLAEEYGINLDLPENLPEVHNIGMTLGYGGNAKSLFKIAASLDHQDIRGNTLRNNLATSFELGLDIPEEIASKYSIKFNTKSVSGWNVPMQVGLLKAKVVAGYRPGSYSSYGWETVFHGGSANLSIILFSLQGYVQEIQGDVTPIRKYGLKSTLGLTLLY